MTTQTIDIPIDDLKAAAEKKGYTLVKDEPKGRWIPEYRNSYWFVTDAGRTQEDLWKNDFIDLFRLSQGNVFKTEEEAEAYLRFLTIDGKLRTEADKEGLDWRDDSRHFIYDLNWGHVEKKCAEDWMPNVHYFSKGRIKEVRKLIGEEDLLFWATYKHEDE